MNDKKIVVSDLFVDIYTNFNVCSQVEKMNTLTKKELYLLIILALDKHDDNDPVVLHNFLTFESIGDDIFELREAFEHAAQQQMTVAGLHRPNHFRDPDCLPDE